MEDLRFYAGASRSEEPVSGLSLGDNIWVKTTRKLSEFPDSDNGSGNLSGFSKNRNGYCLVPG